MDLAKKWRPTEFKDILGNSETLTIIEGQIKDGFEGPLLLYSDLSGVGKTTIARIIAEKLSDKHDTIEFDAGSSGGVDNIRQIREISHFAPMMGKMRLFIIDEAQRLSAAAEDALLKTLEDKAKEVNFIFCTTELHKVKKTIRTRCTELEVRPPTFPEFLIFLGKVTEEEGFNIPKGILELIVRNCKGQVREALKLLESVSHLNEEQQYNFLQKIAEKELELWTNTLIYGDLSARIKLARVLATWEHSLEVVLTQIYKYLIQDRLTQLGTFIKNTDVDRRDDLIQLYDSEIEFGLHLQEFIWQLRGAAAPTDFFEAGLPLLPLRLITTKRVIAMNGINFKDETIVSHVRAVMEGFPPGNFAELEVTVKPDHLIIKTKRGNLIEVSATGDKAESCKFFILYPLGIEELSQNYHLTSRELFAKNIVQDKDRTTSKTTA